MRLPGFATRNLRLKALAAVLAMITWAGVVYASNPPDTRSVSVKVPQDAGAITPYVLVHPIPDIVVRIGGTREHINSFDASQLVVTVGYRTVTHTGIQQLPLQIVNNDRDVLLDNPPSTVTADVDHLDSRTVPVTIVVNPPPPQGYVVSTESATPSSASVIGPQHLLAGLEAQVIVNLATQKTNFQADEAVALYNATGQRLGDFGVTPPTVQVTITVVASLTSRASAVLPSISGAVAAGHTLAGIAVNPPTVVLSGPQDLLNTLDSVSTDAISLNGITGTRSFKVRLRPPAGVSANPDTVTVLVTVNTPAPPSPTATPTASSTPTAFPSPTPTPG